MTKAIQQDIWTTRDNRKIPYAQLPVLHLQQLVYTHAGQAYFAEFIRMCQLAAKVSVVEPQALPREMTDQFLEEVFTKPMEEVLERLESPNGIKLFRLAQERQIELDLTDLRNSVKELITKSIGESFFFYYADRLEVRVTEDPI